MNQSFDVLQAFGSSLISGLASAALKAAWTELFGQEKEWASDKLAANAAMYDVPQNDPMYDYYRKAIEQGYDWTRDPLGIRNTRFGKAAWIAETLAASGRATDRFTMDFLSLLGVDSGFKIVFDMYSHWPLNLFFTRDSIDYYYSR